MKLLIQRVLEGSVMVGDVLISAIGPGLVILVGIHESDNKQIAKKLAQKISKVRLWEKDNKSWNGSVQDLSYEILLVSQFTLYGFFKGNKPDFHYAQQADAARELFEYFCDEAGKAYNPLKIKKGAFQQYMKVTIINDGPLTLEIDEMAEQQEQKQKVVQQQ